jgi:taurine transport system permease protein
MSFHNDSLTENQEQVTAKVPSKVRKKDFKFTVSTKVISIISFVCFILIWEIVTRMGFIKPLFLPSPSKVINTGYKMLSDGNLVIHILASTRRVLLGFFMAMIVALPLGILLGNSKRLKAVFDPIVSIIRPLPSMAWIPLTLLWLGIGEEQKYTIVFMGSVAPALLYTIDATRNVSPLLIKAARNLGASNLIVMREVILPAALPSIFSGMKVVLGLSWTTVISAELVAANEGLGFLIMNGKEYFMTDVVILGMAMISLTVVIIDLILNRMEKMIMPWREE